MSIELTDDMKNLAEKASQASSTDDLDSIMSEIEENVEEDPEAEKTLASVVSAFSPLQDVDLRTELFEKECPFDYSGDLGDWFVEQYEDNHESIQEFKDEITDVLSDDESEESEEEEE